MADRRKRRGSSRSLPKPPAAGHVLGPPSHSESPTHRADPVAAAPDPGSTAGNVALPAPVGTGSSATSPEPPEERNWSVLTGAEIESLELITKETGDYKNCCKAACYDLRFGNQYFRCGDGNCTITTLGNSDPWVEIEPFQSILFSTVETVRLPDGIVGRFGLKIGKALEGLVMQVGPQIEPGYTGPLFGLILNTSGQTRQLVPGSAFASVEFSRMTTLAGSALQPETIKDLQHFIWHQRLEGKLGGTSAIAQIRADLDQCKRNHLLQLNDAAAVATTKSTATSAKTLRVAWISLAVLAVLAIAAMGVTWMASTWPPGGSSSAGQAGAVTDPTSASDAKAAADPAASQDPSSTLPSEETSHAK